MNEPLGPAIGTGLEAIEARDFLRGTRRDARLEGLCEVLGVAMLEAAASAAIRSPRCARAPGRPRVRNRFERCCARRARARVRSSALRRTVFARPFPRRAPASSFPSIRSRWAKPRASWWRGMGPARASWSPRAAATPCAPAIRSRRSYGAPEFARVVAAAFSLEDAPAPARPLVY
jgi:hypothetical protein